SIEHRLDVEGFRMGGDDAADKKLWNWWVANGLDVESSMAHVEAMIHGESYITIAAPDPDRNPSHIPGVPVIRVESPDNFFVDQNPVTRQVRHALRLYSMHDIQGLPTHATLMVPGKTVLLERSDRIGSWAVRDEIETGLSF